MCRKLKPEILNFSGLGRSKFPLRLSISVLQLANNSFTQDEKPLHDSSQNSLVGDLGIGTQATISSSYREVPARRTREDSKPTQFASEVLCCFGD